MGCCGWGSVPRSRWSGGRGVRRGRPGTSSVSCADTFPLAGEGFGRAAAREPHLPITHRSGFSSRSGVAVGLLVQNSPQDCSVSNVRPSGLCPSIRTEAAFQADLQGFAPPCAPFPLTRGRLLEARAGGLRDRVRQRWTNYVRRVNSRAQDEIS